MKYIKLFEDYRGKDEMFRFLGKSFDIDKAWELINKNPEKYYYDGELATISIDEIVKLFGGVISDDGKTKRVRMGVKIDIDYAMSISDDQLNEPGIFVLDGEFHCLIDGWHRAYKKWKRGDTKMSIYVISDPKSLKYIKIP